MLELRFTQNLFEAGEVSIGKTYDKSVIGTMIH